MNESLDYSNVALYILDRFFLTYLLIHRNGSWFLCFRISNGTILKTLIIINE